MSGKHILVAVAWPYASGPLHLGHLAGAYLPPDIFARYHRIIGNNVLMVSGSDSHGTPITVKADQEGVAPEIIVDKFHPEIVGYWESLGISFDLFTTTMTDIHREVTWDLFRRLRENGYISRGTSQQFYDPESERFLPDRYVEGTCPHCGFDQARGDQCDNCGRTLDPEDLIDPRSGLSGAEPELRKTEHYFMDLSKLQEPLLDWLKSRKGWRKHVQNMAIGFTEEGLIDRAITRDLAWGVPLPPEADTLGPGKSIYVWFEAVIGYLSASKEWAQLQSNPEAWRAWWENPAAESYYFIGKDNIVFHTVIWPAMLIGYGGLNLPTDVPANQFITFKGAKASKSLGVGRSIGWYAERLQPDALRFAIASILPEQNDTELSDSEIERRINEELVATWGNLINRVLTLIQLNTAGKVPELVDLEPGDLELLNTIDNALGESGEHIEAVELRAGLRTAMKAAGEVNAYLNRTEPWKTAADDPRRTAITLATAINAIAGLVVAFYPYLPFSSREVAAALGIAEVPEAWARPRLSAGTPVGEPKPLFDKVEL